MTQFSRYSVRRNPLDITMRIYIDDIFAGDYPDEPVTFPRIQRIAEELYETLSLLMFQDREIGYAEEVE